MKKLLLLFALLISISAVSMAADIIKVVNVRVSNLYMVDSSVRLNELTYRAKVYREYTNKGYTFTGLVKIKGITYASFGKK